MCKAMARMYSSLSCLLFLVLGLAASEIESEGCLGVDANVCKSWTAAVEQEDAMQGLEMLQVKGAKKTRNCPLPDADKFQSVEKKCQGQEAPPGEDEACLGGNHAYMYLEDAWKACGQLSSCGAVMQSTKGNFFLRRASDPDTKSEGSKLYAYSCDAEEQDQQVEKKVQAKPAKVPDSNAALTKSPEFEEFEQRLKAKEAQAKENAEARVDIETQKTNKVVAKASLEAEAAEGAQVEAQLKQQELDEVEKRLRELKKETKEAKKVILEDELSITNDKRAIGEAKDDAEMDEKELEDLTAKEQAKAEAELKDLTADAELQDDGEQDAAFLQENGEVDSNPDKQQLPKAYAPVAECPLPNAKTFTKGGKGCPHPGQQANGCLNENRAYLTLEEAWKACNAEEFCGAVMAKGEGFFMRRATDPDLANDDAKLYTFPCKQQVLWQKAILEKAEHKANKLLEHMKERELEQKYLDAHDAEMLAKAEEEMVQEASDKRQQNMISEEFKAQQTLKYLEKDYKLSEHDMAEQMKDLESTVIKLKPLERQAGQDANELSKSLARIKDVINDKVKYEDELKALDKAKHRVEVASQVLSDAKDTVADAKEDAKELKSGGDKKLKEAEEEVTKAWDAVKKLQKQEQAEKDSLADARQQLQKARKDAAEQDSKLSYEKAELENMQERR